MPPASCERATGCAVPGTSARAAGAKVWSATFPSRCGCVASSSCSIGPVRRRKNCGGVHATARADQTRARRRRRCRARAAVDRRADRQGERRRSRHARRPLPRGALSRAFVLPHPARHPQRRAARERQARAAQGPARGRAGGAHPAAAGWISPSRARLEHEADAKTRDFLKSITLHEDADVLVLNKPMGLAVQGGSGTTRHLDGMLEVLRDAPGPAPATGAPARQGHRRLPAGGQDRALRPRRSPRRSAPRSARKIYWALVAGVPKPRQGRISTYPGQGRARGRFVHAHRAPRRGGREPRGHLLRRGRDRRARSWPGSRSSR